MNKDTIYIEPEHDITDVISKLKSAEHKFVALVPPKKAGIFRSAVNIKLIVKAARDSEKVAILVTTDPALIKLAAGAKLPVAASLDSRPEIPKLDKPTEEETEEPEEDSAEPAEDAVVEEFTKQPESAAGIIESMGKNAAAEPRESKSSAKSVPSFEKYRKWIIAGSIALIVIVFFLIWALIIAPAVRVAVKIGVESKSFSESISFTTEKENDTTEYAKQGIFYLSEEKLSDEAKVEFEATGQKDIGDHASGTITAYAYFRSAGSIAIPAGSTFSYNGLEYTSSSASALKWDGDDSNCGSGSSIVSGCLISANIVVTAVEPGERYNLEADKRGWDTNGVAVSAYNSSAIAGGNSKVITVVQQSDIDKAKTALSSSSETENKKKLLESVKDGEDLVIESSFKQSVSEPVVTPALGEQVEDGKKATLTVTTSASIYLIDLVRVEDFITEKANLSAKDKIYSIGSPFVERFTEESEGSYVGKLKTTYKYGVEVTEDSIAEKIAGRRIGEVKSLIVGEFTGVKDVQIFPSTFWVNSVPNNLSKITIDLDIEE